MYLIIFYDAICMYLPEIKKSYPVHKFKITKYAQPYLKYAFLMISGKEPEPSNPPTVPAKSRKVSKKMACKADLKREGIPGGFKVPPQVWRKYYSRIEK